MVFNLFIAVHELRAFHYCGLFAPPVNQEALIIHSAGWTPHTALICTSGTFKRLGVEYPVNQADSTSLHHMKHNLLVVIRALSIKKATPKSVNLVIAKCPYARAHTSAFSPRGPYGNVRKSTQSLLRNFAAARKTFAPPRPKTSTSLYGKVD